MQIPLIISVFVSVTASAQNLTMGDYLGQVESKNQNLIAAKESSEGAQLRAVEGDLMYSPNLFVNTYWKRDKFKNALLPTAYNDYENDNYNIGIRQMTSFGLDASVSYMFNRQAYLGGQDFQTGAITNREFWEGTPKIDLTFSLWRNFLGGETQAQKQMTDSSALATQYNQSFMTKATRAQAESAYVRLAAAQELIRTYKNSVESAQDLLKWINRQVGLNLGDRSDLYQAQANMEAQNLNLQSSIDEQRTAARDFNKLRNVDSDEVTEKLTMPQVSALEVPARAEIRDDVRAAQEQARLAGAQAQLGYEKNRPTLEVFGSLALNSRENEFSRTFSTSWQLGQQTTNFGLRFNMPLGLGMTADARSGYTLERDAAEKLVLQKTFEQEVEWKDLVKQLSEAKKRYEIADRLAAIQHKKVDNETLRLKRGRTTTYQTVVYNQDFSTAEAARIQALSRVLNIHSQMKTFGGSEK